MRYEGYIYPGTQHGFNNDTTPRYDAAAAKLAWSAHGRLVQQARPHVIPRLTALDDTWSGEPNIVLKARHAGGEIIETA